MDPSPSAQKMLKENEIDSSQISGSGKRGQVLKSDVIDTLAAKSTASKVGSGKKSAV